MTRIPHRSGRALVAVALCSLALALAACDSGGIQGGSGNRGGASETAATTPSGPVAAVVVLKNLAFTPSSVVINAGQTVEWKWEDAPRQHNVTFATFASPTQATGTYFHTFDAPGRYPYRSTLHPTMTGVVVVRPS